MQCKYFRWAGFVLAIIGAYILSNGDAETQWIGWSVSISSCSIWAIAGWKDKDFPRMLMELMYLTLAIRGVVNWW